MPGTGPTLKLQGFGAGSPPRPWARREGGVRRKWAREGRTTPGRGRGAREKRTPQPWRVRQGDLDEEGVSGFEEPY